MHPRAAAGLAALGLGLLPGAAAAHAFSTGKDAYGNFLEGAGLVLSAPGLLLPVLALALALGLWREEGLLAAWPHALIGSLLGLALAPFVGPWAMLVPIAFGMVLAGLAALVPLSRIAPALPLLAGLLALATLSAALEGHGYGEVTMATRAGLLFGMHFVLAAGAGLVRLSRMATRHPARDILWRIAESWITAILMLYLAFTLAG